MHSNKKYAADPPSDLVESVRMREERALTIQNWETMELYTGLRRWFHIGVNPAGDAGDVSPPIFWLVGTSMGMSPPIRGGNVVEYELLIASMKRKQR